jgi:hypothetical protein
MPMTKEQEYCWPETDHFVWIVLGTWPDWHTKVLTVHRSAKSARLWKEAVETRTSKVQHTIEKVCVRSANPIG